MIIILDAFGNVQSSVPESSIYRGSNDANRITVLAPLPASTQFLLACQLPNGEYLTEQYMSFVESQETDDKGYNIWTLGINKAMTDISGKLLLQFKAISPKAIITSFECSFEVQRGVISAEDTGLASLAEQILAKISQISGDITDLENKKQDKEDTGISTNSWQTSLLVVGALNNTIAKTSLNSTNIETNTENIAKNTGDIAEIKQIIGTGEDYIGQMEATTKPTTEELNAFVAANTTPSRSPKAGDVIIFVLLVPDDTDQVYKYTYNGKIWNSYLIPSVEEAKNGTKGIVEGTYGIGANYDTLVDIAGGQILNIYIKDATGVYRNIHEYINNNAGSIANIISGNTQVGNALKAVQDALGNVIDTTYITKANGVTKSDLYGYALPKTFNDTFYLSSTGYIDTVPTTPETGIQFSKAIPKDEANFTQVAVVDREAKGQYQISNKNSTSQNYWITVDTTGTYYILVHAYLKKVGQERISLYQEVTSPLNLEADKFYNIKMGSRFYEVDTILDVDLTDNIEYEISVKYEDGTPENSEFTIYSNELYPSAMNLNIQGAIIKTASGLLGELPVIDVVLSTTETATETNVPLTTNEVLTDKTECLFKVNVNNFTEFGGFINSKTLSFKDNTGADFKFVVSGNYLKSNLATVYDFRQVFNRIENTSLELLFRGFVEINENGANYIYVDMDDLDNYADKDYVELTAPKELFMGADGVEETNVYNFMVENADTFIDFRTNRTRFLLDLHLPVVGALSLNKEVTITFGDTVYYLYNILKGNEHVTIGDLKQVDKYNNATGYRFIFHATFFQNDDITGFAIIPTISMSDILSLSSDEMDAYMADGGLTDGQVALCSNLGTNNGYELGSLYKFVITYPTTYTWVKMENTYIELNVAPTAVQGTITNDQFAILKANDNNGILFDHEYYKLSTKGRVEGYRTYFTIERENGETSIKTITITESTLAWVLVDVDVETKPVDETYTIASEMWRALSGNDPYKFMASVTAEYTIGTKTEVGIINDQPALFANYGFVVGSVSNQTVIIFAVSKPTADVNLSVRFRG